MDLPRSQVQRGSTSHHATGTWWPVSESGRRSACIVCPTCQRGLALIEHKIGSDGTVAPSVVCAYTGCTFHQHVRLLDW